MAYKLLHISDGIFGHLRRSNFGNTGEYLVHGCHDCIGHHHIGRITCIVRTFWAYMVTTIYRNVWCNELPPVCGYASCMSVHMSARMRSEEAVMVIGKELNPDSPHKKKQKNKKQKKKLPSMSDHFGGPSAPRSGRSFGSRSPPLLRASAQLPRTEARPPRPSQPPPCEPNARRREARPCAARLCAHACVGVRGLQAVHLRARAHLSKMTRSGSSCSV